jgi:hypothetical protein
MEDTKVQENEIKQAGFTFLVDETGKVTLTPVNVGNDFELVGMIDYVHNMKHDLLGKISNNTNYRTLKAVSLLANSLAKLEISAPAPAEELKEK